MLFAVTFLITPAGLFGVPDNGTTVLPVTTSAREIFSDALTNTAAKVGHGSLSIFRSEEDKVSLAFEMDGAQSHLEDNYLTVNLEADAPFDAYVRAAAVADAILANLAVDNQQPFTHHAVYICDETGQPYPPPLYTNLMRFTTYNLDTLKQSINTAVHASCLHDHKLERALHYYEHALILHHNRQQLARPGSAHYQSVMASVLLNLWKAVTTIIGEAGTDKDHQKRYREYGIDRDFVLNEIQTLKRLRDNYDVAHYTLDTQATDELEDNYGEALSTTTEVIKKYREHLRSVSTA